MIKKLFIVVYNCSKDNTKVQKNRFLFPVFYREATNTNTKETKEGVSCTDDTPSFTLLYILPYIYITFSFWKQLSCRLI